MSAHQVSKEQDTTVTGQELRTPQDLAFLWNKSLPVESKTHLPYTYEDLVAWILCHKNKYAWPMSDWKDIGASLLDAVRMGGLRYVANAQGIQGVACVIPFPPMRLLWVQNVLARPIAMRQLAKEYLQAFPNWRMIMCHKGQKVFFNEEQTSRILNYFVTYGRGKSIDN